MTQRGPQGVPFRSDVVAQEHALSFTIDAVLRVSTRWGLSLGLLLTSGCGVGSLSPSVTPAGDPTPLAKCKIAASHDSPLVTEWPASEKARLETLLGNRAVAVAYSGCELRIVDQCSLAGKYAWRRTTLATDTVEIQSADELWAKLPLGAASLEGELGRTGRLAVRTTVSGQLQLEGSGELPNDGTCSGVTHVVTAISVGAFRLMSGGSARAQGSVSTPLAGAGGAARREESLLREAGDPERCREAADAGPNADCGSPIQLFLRPVQTARTDSSRAMEAADARARERGLLVSLAPPDPDERWSLHDADGNSLCTLPCDRWIGPRSGYYLERQQTRGYKRRRIDIPNELPHDPGTHVSAAFVPGRGNVIWSSILFYGMGIPMALGGVSTLILGLVLSNDPDRSDSSGFLLGTSAFMFAGAAGTGWWWLYSRGDRFDTYVAEERTGGVRLMPLRLSGSF